ncbi:MAG: LacI family transcriptional regulator [Phycisphaerae bacterium]|nr:LacI family transcriptional regulator [Phycisphaerae bacterium]
MANIVTIRDIAKQVGVTHSTVSRVINGKSNISEETRQIVLQTIREMGYQPNRRARLLVGRREGKYPIFIELVMCHLSPKNEGVAGGFQMQVIQGIQQEAHEDGQVDYAVSYCETDQNAGDQLLRYQRSNGVILLGNSDRGLVEQLLERKIKVVLADHEHEGLGVDSVISDNVAGGMMAAKYLMSKGFKRIGWLGGPPEVISWSQRFDGFKLQLNKMGIELQQKDCRYTQAVELEAFETVMMQWISQGDVPPALVTPSSMGVPMILHALQANGLKCPADVSIVTFDNDSFIEISRPKPATLATFPLEIGRKAMQRMMQIIRQEKKRFSSENRGSIGTHRSGFGKRIKGF